MRLTERQRREAASAIEALVTRVRILRDEEGWDAPADEAMGEVFTDLDRYDLQADEEINQCLGFLHGLAVGLGLPSSYDLYLAYRRGFEAPSSCPAVPPSANAA